MCAEGRKQRAASEQPRRFMPGTPCKDRGACCFSYTQSAIESHMCNCVTFQVKGGGFNAGGGGGVQNGEFPSTFVVFENSCISLSATDTAISEMTVYSGNQVSSLRADVLKC